MRFYKSKTAPFILFAIAGCSMPDGSKGPTTEVKQGAIVSADVKSQGSGVDPTGGSAAAAKSPPPASSAVVSAVVPTRTQVKVGSGAAVSAGVPSSTAPSLATVNGPPAERPVAADQPGTAAAASLGTLSELVSQDPNGRGFTSSAEARSAALDTPLKLFFVGLNDLRAYQSGKDPRGLLFDRKEFVYPVVAAGDIRSSVVVRQRGDGAWEAVQFGRGAIIKDVDNARVNVAGKRMRAKTDFSLVEIPTLGARFLANDEGGVLWLSPISDVSGTALRAQESYLASDVFSALQPLAANVGPGNQ